MAITVTFTGTFQNEPGQKGSASVKEQDFVERVCDLAAQFGGHITGGSVAGDHIAGNIGSNGRITYTKIHG